ASDCSYIAATSVVYCIQYVIRVSPAFVQSFWIKSSSPVPKRVRRCARGGRVGGANVGGHPRLAVAFARGENWRWLPTGRGWSETADREYGRGPGHRNRLSWIRRRLPPSPVDVQRRRWHANAGAELKRPSSVSGLWAQARSCRILRI